MTFVMIDPLNYHHIHTTGEKNLVPCVVGLKSSVLLSHGVTPIRIGKSTTINIGKWRESQDLKIYVVGWDAKPSFPMGAHTRSIAHRGDRYRLHRYSW
jgi:hypothetical protein